MCSKFKEESITNFAEMHKYFYTGLDNNTTKASQNFFINIWMQLEDRLFPAYAHPRNYKVQELLYKDKDSILLTCLSHIISILSTGWLTDITEKHGNDNFSLEYTVKIELAPYGQFDLSHYIGQFVGRVKELLEEKAKKSHA